MNLKLFYEIIKARKKLMVFMCILALANLGLYIFTSTYQVPHLNQLQDQWAEKRRLLRSGVTQDAVSVYKQGIKDLADWRSRIPPKREFARFVGDLFETASNNSLSVGGVTYKPVEVKEDNLIAFEIDFNVSGKYAGVKSFIADLEKSRDIMYVQNISLNSSKPTEDIVNMKLQLMAYFRGEGS